MKPVKTNTLLYGFGPFAQYRHNLTMDVIAELKTHQLAQCVIFNTQFSCKMFKDALEQYRPQLIIGLGQDSRARKIRIERKAKNWRLDLNGEGQKINQDGPEYLFVPLKIRPDAHSTVTYDAGTYVCNYSMYLMCEYAQKTGGQYAFLHLPMDVDVCQAAEFVIANVKAMS